MSRACCLLGIALSTVAPTSGVARAEPEERELPPSVVFGRVASSTVIVEGILKEGRSQGSGVVIGRELVVTNHHVVNGTTSIQVRQGEAKWAATVAAFDAKHDLVLLKVAGLGRPRVAIRPSVLVKVGERVYAIGAPKGLELNLSDGLVSAIRPDKGRPVLQTTASISAGSSGGGLFDGKGRLVGIATFSRGGQNLNVAHPTEWIAELRSAYANAPGEEPEDSPDAQYSVAQRPEALRCHLQTRATWGLFSGGAEVLDTRSIKVDWEFVDFHHELARRLARPAIADPHTQLVLADMNREAGMVSFAPSQPTEKEEYFFSLADDGSVLMTFIEPVDFHGQPRIVATSGPCDAITNNQIYSREGQTLEQRCAAGDTDAYSHAGKEAARKILSRRGQGQPAAANATAAGNSLDERCSGGDATSCIAAGKECGDKHDQGGAISYYSIAAT